MLVAYRRGLLHPYYERGMQSHVRENMILESIAMEMDADHLQRVSDYQNVMTAPHLDPRKLNTAWESTRELLIEIRNKYEGNPVMAACRNYEGLAQRANKVFRTLHANGTIAAFLNQSQKLIEKYVTQTDPIYG